MKYWVLSIFLLASSQSVFAQGPFVPSDTMTTSTTDSIKPALPNFPIIDLQLSSTPEQGVCDPEFLKIYKGAKCWYGTIYSDKLLVQKSQVVLNGKVIGNYNPKIHNIFLGFEGNDLIEGGDGIDIIDGGIGINTLYGKNNIDTLIGNDDADYLHGGSGDDILFGFGGDDWLYDGPGCDFVTGGAGDDHFFADFNEPKKNKCPLGQWLDFSWGLGANGDSNGS